MRNDILPGCDVLSFSLLDGGVFSSNDMLIKLGILPVIVVFLLESWCLVVMGELDNAHVGINPDQLCVSAVPPNGQCRRSFPRRWKPSLQLNIACLADWFMTPSLGGFNNPHGDSRLKKRNRFMCFIVDTSGLEMVLALFFWVDQFNIYAHLTTTMYFTPHLVLNGTHHHKIKTKRKSRTNIQLF